jgi:hypothetical protein
MHRLISRFSYANVMATVAVFVALSGSSYAAFVVTGKQIRDDSITSADIRNRSVTGTDIRNNSLTSADIKNGYVTGADIRDKSLTAADFDGPVGAGPKGDASASGPKGEKGDAGAVGPKGETGTTGAVGPKGESGTTGDPGATGEPGDTGPTGIVQTATIAGPVSMLPPSGPFLFAGPPVQVTTTAGQRLTAAASAGLGTSSPTDAITFDVTLCYQPSGGGSLTRFLGEDFVTVRAPATFGGSTLPVSATATTVPGPGTWNVGLCVRNAPGLAALNFNSSVIGWVQVTN